MSFNYSVVTWHSDLCAYGDSNVFKLAEPVSKGATGGSSAHAANQSSSTTRVVRTGSIEMTLSFSLDGTIFCWFWLFSTCNCAVYNF